MLQRHPADVWIHQSLAALLVDTQQYAEAARFYVAALALRPRSIAIRNHISLTLCASGEPEAAIAMSRDAVELAPKDGVARAHLAAALISGGDRAGGLKTYADALALAEDKAAVHLAFGLLMSRAGDGELRLAACRSAVGTKPGYFAYTNLGGALRDAGDPEAAVAALRQAIALAPGRYRAHQRLGNALGDLGRHEEAAEAYGKYIRIRPLDWLGYNDVSVALRRLRKYDDALAAAARAEELNPGQSLTQFNLGRLWLDQGELHRAAKAYYRALPLGADAYHGLGHVQMAMGDLEQAEIALRESIRLDPNNAGSLSSLGILLYRRGDFDGTVEQFRAASRLAKGDVLMQGNLAEVLAQDDPEVAFEILERVAGESGRRRGGAGPVVRRSGQPRRVAERPLPLFDGADEDGEER